MWSQPGGFGPFKVFGFLRFVETGTFPEIASDCRDGYCAAIVAETGVRALETGSRQPVDKIALELHGNQCVYNVPSLKTLRNAVGSVIGANLDPSHLFWMGADPLFAAETLGSAVYHVHAKDTFLNAPVRATTSLLENGSLIDIPARSWSYITLGFGHGEEWWRQFCYRLKMGGYDGWLSIEHEDVLLNSLEGLEKSVALLKGVMPDRPADYKPQEI